MYVIFYDFHLRVEGIADKALEAFHAFLQAYFGVTPFVDAAYVDSVFRQNLLYLIQNHGLEPVNAQRK